MADFPWIRLHEQLGQRHEDFPHLADWFAGIAARPAVATDMVLLEDIVDEIDDRMWDNLWGATQFERR